MYQTSTQGKTTLRAITKDVELDFGDGILGDRYHTLPIGNAVVNSDEYGKKVLHHILTNSPNVLYINTTHNKFDTSDFHVAMFDGRVCKVDVKCRSGNYDTLLIDLKKIVENDYVFIVWIDRRMVEVYDRARILWLYHLGLIKHNDNETIIVPKNCVVQIYNLLDIVNSNSFQA